MTLEEFKKSLSASAPPPGLTPHLQALWYDGKNDWHRSHEVAQDILDNDGSWIHAYLHRKEGDLFNAGYWYRKAKKPQPTSTLDKEWEEIITMILKTNGI